MKKTSAEHKSNTDAMDRKVLKQQKKLDEQADRIQSGKLSQGPKGNRKVPQGG